MRTATVLPPYESVSKCEDGLLWQIENVGIAVVDAIPLRMDIDKIAQQRHRLLEGGFLEADGAPGVKLRTENVGREGDGASGVLFLREAEEVCSEADLRLHFLLAVTVVVVRNHGDDHALLIASADLEGLAVVVKLVGVAPAHAVAALARGGFRRARQAERGFFHADQMRSQNYAAGVAGPVSDVESGIVFRQVGVAGVAENRFDEIEIAHQAAGSEKARLHGARRIGACGRADGG